MTGKKKRFAVVLAIVLGGCTDYVDPKPPKHPFNPGNPADGVYGYGSGSDPGIVPIDMGPPKCEDAAKRCAAQFVYAGSQAIPLTGQETLVEVRGDYSPGGWQNGTPLTYDAASSSWKGAVPAPYNKSFQYKFHIVYQNNTDRWVPDPANGITAPDGVGGFNSVYGAATCDVWTCASTQIVCPGSAATGAADEFDWRDAVIYFVFVDRFLDGSAANNAPLSDGNLFTPANWQGGDWAGVKQKIEDGYFTSLGVNTLWLTVPMMNATSTGVGSDGTHYYSGYHGYWPKDPTMTEPRFGSQADLTALVASAHAHGLKVLVDYAMNHVHKDAPIYQQHMNDGWFNPAQVNGQDCVCNDNGPCTWNGAPKTCWFTNYLPDFNFNNAAARQYSVDNLVWWIKTFDLDGFRLDAIKHVEMVWLTDVRSRLISEVEATSKRHTYLVGETFTGDQGLIKQFVDPCQKLDGQFDFPLRVTLDSVVLMRQGKMSDLATFMNGNDGFYGTSVMSTFIGNHDMPRAIHFAEDSPKWSNVWDGGGNLAWSPPGQPGGSSAYERVALAMTVLETNRGAPLIYYGDEVGLAGAGDPDNRRFMPWSGYSSAQTALLERTKKLGTIRAAHTALRRGDRTTITVDDDTWLYRMKDDAEEVFVGINRSDSTRMLSGLPAGAYVEQLTGGSVSGPQVSVPARGAVILTK